MWCWNSNRRQIVARGCLLPGSLLPYFFLTTPFIRVRHTVLWNWKLNTIPRSRPEGIVRFLEPCRYVRCENPNHDHDLIMLAVGDKARLWSVMHCCGYYVHQHLFIEVQFHWQVFHTPDVHYDNDVRTLSFCLYHFHANSAQWHNSTEGRWRVRTIASLLQFNCRHGHGRGTF